VHFRLMIVSAWSVVGSFNVEECGDCRMIHGPMVSTAIECHGLAIYCLFGTGTCPCFFLCAL
jgi:hypothetical protein